MLLGLISSLGLSLSQIFRIRKVLRYDRRYFRKPKKSKNVAMCSTGDSFVDDHMMTSWAKMLFKDKLVHDMESYALAKVCATYGKKFYSFKYISDAGEIKDWAKTLEKASKALSKFYVDSFLK